MAPVKARYTTFRILMCKWKLNIIQGHFSCSHFDSLKIATQKYINKTSFIGYAVSFQFIKIFKEVFLNKSIRYSNTMSNIMSSWMQWGHK